MRKSRNEERSIAKVFYDEICQRPSENVALDPPSVVVSGMEFWPLKEHKVL